MTLENPVLRILRYFRYLHVVNRSRADEFDEKRNAPSALSFVRADDGQQAVVFERLAHGLTCIKVQAASYAVMHEALRALLLPKVLDRIRPQYVAHEPGHWRLTEAVQLCR